MPNESEPRAATKDLVFRFEQCEVRVGPREVVLNGHRQRIEPLAFDLLVYLLEHRDRVVAKDELLERVWNGRCVSVGVLARAVFKARQAIGDTGKAPALIRTIHRKGYRFACTVEREGSGGASGEAQRSGQSHAAMPPPRISTVSLALLPFENLTGQPDLDWVELGLMSVVAKALAADSRLAVVPLQSVQTAMASLPEQADLSERAGLAVRLLGARRVVHVQVRCEGERFCLDYAVGVPPLVTRHRLKGGDLAPLARRLAAAIEATLFPEESAAVIEFESPDPVAVQTLARAMQAAGEQNWRVAVDLFQVVLDIEPDSQAVQLERLAALSQLGDDAAFALGKHLLEQSRATGNGAQEAIVHHALGRAYSGKRLFEPARRHLDEALRLGTSQGAPDWITMAYLFRSSVAIFQHDFACAKKCLQRMQELCDASENHLHRLAWMINTAWMNAHQGNLAAATQLAHEGRDLSCAYQLKSDFAHASLNLASYCGEQGLFRAALKHGRESLATGLAQAEQGSIAPAANTLCWLHRELRTPSESAGIVAVLEQVQRERSPALLPGVLMARGHHAACAQNHGEAVRAWQAAISLCRELDAQLPEHEALPWLIVSLVRSQQGEEALTALADTRERPGVGSNARLVAALLHCEALQMHASGRRALALERLHASAEAAPMGLWRANACIDSAWLWIEAGDLARARKLMRDLGSWIDEHPIGMALDARLNYANGNFAAAAATQQRLLQMIPVDEAGYHLELSRRYTDAALRSPTSIPSLPPTPWLPTRA